MYLIIDKKGNTFLNQVFTDDMLELAGSGLITVINTSTLQQLHQSKWVEIDSFPDDFLELKNSKMMRKSFSAMFGDDPAITVKSI